MFDMPADIPPQIVSHQCQVVYEKYIHPANDFLKAAYERRINAAKRVGITDKDKPENKSKNKQQSPQEMVEWAATFEKKRYETIMEYGAQLGAQEGLVWRYGKIDKILKSKEIQNLLDKAFNFNIVMAPHNVIYPVIEEAKNAVHLSSDGQSARKTRIAWEIVRPARIVGTAPTWRNYLRQPGLRHHKPVPEGLMPMNDRESKLWLESICRGFSNGARQANLIFSDRMQSLVRDYKGMLRFRTLVRMNIVTEPKVIEGRLGVTMAKSGQRVNVDDRMVRIAAPATFLKASEWKTVRTLPRETGTSE